MFSLILLFLKLLLCPLCSLQKELFLTIALQQKEIDILKRSLSFRHKKPRFSKARRFFAFLLALCPKLKSGLQTLPLTPFSDGTVRF